MVKQYTQRDIFFHNDARKKSGKDVRLFDGKRFKLVTTYAGYDAESLAKHDANRFRKKGTLARVVKTAYGLDLWVHNPQGK